MHRPDLHGQRPAGAIGLSRQASAVALAGLLLALAGCSSAPTDRVLGLLTPYRVDIVQGNVVTQEQIAAVRPGMSRLQVRDVLGSPLLTDPFHADRWDYVFTIRRPGAEPQRRHIVLQFDGETLKTVEAPPLPTEREFVTSITPQRFLNPKVPPLELTEERRQALPKPPAAAGAAPSPEAPQGPAREYPPLEPRR
ncbi:outer membrane protein assembly factor BamE [Aquabacterium sp. J223]|uniref:outer membrane protein assembly factor BamE n=1 Tax=Aquabacterium sp. J223 TaxID=2898431 RepID=UPI0021ADF68A|nr:outer membrane protein assembly factor BamE [Aquabacterium sp. J223]UUX95895.1 outer membrane protein assembly factor BamE [Aquabacterium sp. J223]